MYDRSFLASGKRDSEALSALPEEKRNALLETKTRIMWLLTEEIMHGLLRAGPVSEPVVRYIESQLMKKNPFVDFPTTITIPLSFVKNQNQSRRVFLEQLEHNTTTLYRLVRVGNCFYASDNGFFSANYDAITGDDPPGVIDSYDEGLGISTYNPEEHEQAASIGHDEFCEGLGISIFEPAFGDDDMVEEDTDDPEEQSTRQQLYWLLIIPQAHTVQVYFYSKMPQSVNRTEIIRVTKTMISDIMERTNKLVLLYHMNDTRICRYVYLLWMMLYKYVNYVTLVNILLLLMKRRRDIHPTHPMTMTMNTIHQETTLLRFYQLLEKILLMHHPKSFILVNLDVRFFTPTNILYTGDSNRMQLSTCLPPMCFVTLLSRIDPTHLFACVMIVLFILHYARASIHNTLTAKHRHWMIHVPAHLMVHPYLHPMTPLHFLIHVVNHQMAILPVTANAPVPKQLVLVKSTCNRLMPEKHPDHLMHESLYWKYMVLICLDGYQKSLWICLKTG